MMSLQAASRSFMRIGVKPLNQQLYSARNFCAAPTIAEKIQVIAFNSNFAKYLSLPSQHCKIFQLFSVQCG